MYQQVATLPLVQKFVIHTGDLFFFPYEDLSHFVSELSQLTKIFSYTTEIFLTWSRSLLHHRDLSLDQDLSLHHRDLSLHYTDLYLHQSDFSLHHRDLSHFIKISPYTTEISLLTKISPTPQRSLSWPRSLYMLMIFIAQAIVTCIRLHLVPLSPSNYPCRILKSLIGLKES